MKIIWEISERDVQKVQKFVNDHKTPLVEERINRNVNKQNVELSKDKILKVMLTCLLSSHHNLGTERNLRLFLTKEPFIINDKFLTRQNDIEKSILEILASNGLTRYFDKVPRYFARNYLHLFQTNWELLTKLETASLHDLSLAQERALSDYIDQIFKGFGSSQARRFLQMLGLSKYEIPIEQVSMAWLQSFDFPIPCTSIALQDKAFYHFVSDGIQLLCAKANIYPCVLDAAIISSNDLEAVA